MHVDVARLDGEGRIGKIKESMSLWLEDAMKRAPALLILDSIDTLLPPENEVSWRSRLRASAYKHS